MMIIEKIEIRYFRSFDDDRVVISNLKDLNIFSGGNDSGKSNILRALNLFFNNEISPGIPFDINRDLSIKREIELKGQDKPKKFVDITLHFKSQKTKLREERFSIKKRWNAFSQHSTTVYKDSIWQAEIFNLYKEPNIIKKFEDDEKYKGQRGKSINTFLNKIFFFYIPAVKDEKFYSHLYSRLLTKIRENEQIIEEGATEKIFSTIEQLEKLINTHTSLLLTGIDGISTRFSTPEKLEDFFSAFDLNTKDPGAESDGGKGVSIKSRGDGIRAKTIPLLLELLENNEKNVQRPLFIWGFEEPENSYEYKNAQLLADQFMNKYSVNKQIFITTHSFNFLSLQGDNISKYRVWKDSDYSSKIVNLPENENIQQYLLKMPTEDQDRLYEELGIPLLNNELHKIWEEKTLQVNTLRQIIKNTKSEDKVCLLTEGNTDVEFITKFFNKYDENWQEKYKFIDTQHGQQNGTEYLSNVLLSISATNPSAKFIGIFDNDKAGKDKYDLLKTKSLHKNVKCITLPELDWAKEWNVKLPLLDNTEIKVDLNGKALAIEMYFWKIFEENFDITEKCFIFERDPKLPTTIKTRLQQYIRAITTDIEFPDGKKIIDLINGITF